MRFLYIFPHPDDESFGPAAAMHQQLGEGHEVHLLTLTRGGATRQRQVLGLGIEEMGAVRYKEMLEVERTLGLTSMTVLDHPDSGMQEMDPRVLEGVVQEHILRLRPDILVTYPVHGVSGFHDHLVTHAVVKRVYLSMRDEGESWLRRLAFITLPDSGEPVFQEGRIRLKRSTPKLIDCILTLSAEDVAALRGALSCYTTYQDTIAQSGVIESIGDRLHFEFFQEYFDPPVSSVSDFLRP